MANDESALREVDRQIAEDRQMEFFQKFGPALIGGGAAIVLAVAGWQLWTAQKTRSASAAAGDFRVALEQLPENPEAGRAALQAIASEASGGYGVLADMRVASSLAANGDRAGALAAYRKVYDDAAASKRLRELARLRAAYLSVADGRDAVLKDIGPLAEEQGVFGHYARELSAIAALDAGDYQTAEDMFEAAAAAEDAPQGVRARAPEFAALAAAGRAGVNIKGEARVEDLMKALGAGAPDLGHEGHAHEDGAHEAAPASQESMPQGAAAPGEKVEDE